MVEIMQILLMNTGVSSVVLLFLLFLSKRKISKSKDERVYLSKDMMKIKEEISED
ncbi:hypothetical protein J4423_04360 [Candidatus Pacearchaeota archaeon]|nr:hypothetical protein [Candidatus Pacearchaeota archaeon]